MYRLPDALRPALAAPFGPVHDTKGALRAVKGRTIVAVGDVVTQTFLDAGILPKLMLVDGVTQRGAVVEGALQNLPTHGVRRLNMKNPPAHVTKPLIAAMDRALREKGSTLIVIDGEEDLAALPAMIVAPDGAVVCYGQPHQGVVVVPITPETRRKAQDILNQMEVK